MYAHRSESQDDGASRTSFGVHADTGLWKERERNSRSLTLVNEGEIEAILRYARNAGGKRIHLGGVVLRVHRQSSTGNPGTWENSLALLVTNVAPSDSA
jgi:hypothetical protein